MKKYYINSAIKMFPNQDITNYNGKENCYIDKHKTKYFQKLYEFKS